MIDRFLHRSSLATAACAIALVCAPVLSAGVGAAEVDELAPDPIAAALAALPEDVRVYNDHVVTLASPFMEGRVPGSRGMETAKQYVEFWFEAAGLAPAFEGESAGAGASFRQPFPLRGTSKLVRQSLTAPAVGTFEAESDYTALSLGGSGRVRGDVVFCGYSIEEGPDGYQSYDEDDRLDGRIALVLRFEPMTEAGRSRFTDSGRWSGSAALVGKVRSAVDRGAGAVVIVNTPGADDPRTAELLRFEGGGTGAADVPVFMLSAEAAERLVAAGDPQRRSLTELRRLADQGRMLQPLAVELALETEIEALELIAENVGGLLAGRGELAGELVVIGAHLDHLGMGHFGSRDQRNRAGKVLHPGADDNASGVAGILMIADKLAADYAALPPERPLRSVLFLAFSAEESGLNGARHYVAHPIRPLSDHALMMNFDMIGRIEERRLAIAGVGSAQGLEDWLRPIFDASSLTIVARESGGGGSDHLAFLREGVPALFAIIADLHEDYHTPDDTSDKINRVDAVKAVRLWREIALAAAQRAEPFEFVQVQAAARSGPGRADVRVRFGIAPGDYDEGEGGVLVGRVSEGTSAAEAGVLAGDVLVSWEGEKIDNVGTWMGQLARHDPGDTVAVGVLREGAMLELEVVLQASRASDQ